MEHLGYPKIAERSDGRATSPAGTWVATEKIHGAHLVVATDGHATRVGKRRAWLDNAEPFFGWQLLRPELEGAAHAVHRHLGSPKTVRLFGELFGGSYPHRQVRTLHGMSAVQTGVWYAPDIRFALFDVLVEADAHEEPVLLSDTETRTLGGALGVLLVPLLARGPKAAVQELPVRFQTRIPPLLHLAPIENNMAEGIVYKPDARTTMASHFALKRKIPEFDETRFDESMPWDPHARLDMPALQAIATRMVNDPRLASARSKMGPVPLMQLRDEIVLDVLVDLECAFPTAFGALAVQEDESLRSHIAAVTKAALLISQPDPRSKSRS